MHTASFDIASVTEGVMLWIRTLMMPWSMFHVPDKKKGPVDNRRSRYLEPLI